MKTHLTVSILMPVYKGSPYLKEALESVFRQNFNFYELIVVDDNKPTDIDEIERTRKIISGFKEKRIKYIKNEKNLGSQGTIKKLASQAKGEMLFYLCQDDILSKDSLQKTHEAFLTDNVGVVTRPYFWFEKEINKPVRVVYPPDQRKDTVFSLADGERAISAIFGSVGQLSGLAFRKEWITTPFNLDVFPGHIYPFAGMLKEHNCVFLKDFTVAVRIESSQARNLSSIYDQSPLASWVKMFNTVYYEKEFDAVRKLGIKHIATHYVGLVQIKNFGSGRAVRNEIVNTVKFYPKSLVSPKFWFYSLLTLFTPRQILVKLSDSYKRHVLAKSIGGIEFEY